MVSAHFQRPTQAKEAGAEVQEMSGGSEHVHFAMVFAHFQRPTEAGAEAQEMAGGSENVHFPMVFAHFQRPTQAEEAGS